MLNFLQANKQQSAGDDFVSKAGRFLFGNTAKFINQGYQEGKQVVNTTRQAIDTHNESNASKEYTAAVKSGDKDRIQKAKDALAGRVESVSQDNDRENNDFKGFKKNGGLFNAGTITNEQEAKQGTAKGALKIAAGTGATALEIVPFAKGAKAAQLAEKGAVAANDLSKGEKALQLVKGAGKLALQNGAYGAASTGLSDVASGDKVTLEDLAKGALSGVATGVAGAAVGKGLEKGSAALKNMGEDGFIKIPGAKGEGEVHAVPDDLQDFADRINTSGLGKDDIKTALHNGLNSQNKGTREAAQALQGSLDKHGMTLDDLHSAATAQKDVWENEFADRAGQIENDHMQAVNDLKTAKAADKPAIQAKIDDLAKQGRDLENEYTGRMKGTGEEPVQKSPTKINPGISEDLQGEINRGAVSSKVEQAKTGELQIGSDALGEVDNARVAKYKDDIKNGNPIDPLVVSQDEKGNTFVQDGKHRLQAANELGIQDVPIVKQQKGATAATQALQGNAATQAKASTIAAGDSVSFHDVNKGGTESKPYTVKSILKMNNGSKLQLEDAKGNTIWTTPESVEKNNVKISEQGGIRPQDAEQSAFEDAHNAGDTAAEAAAGEKLTDPALRGESMSPEAKAKMISDMREGKAPKVEAPKETQKPIQPVSLSEALDKQLAEGTGVKAPEDVAAALKKSGKVATPASKQDWTEHYRDPASVLGTHFGEVGTTTAYKLQQGAKTVSDLEEAVQPDIAKAQKLLKNIAKSDVGRADIQDRVSKALEDRANADSYLKTPKEKELYQATQKVFDFFKNEREKRGLSTVSENYSPRVAMKNALDAPDRLVSNVKQAFSPNVESQFSKQRLNDLPEKELNTKVVDLLNHYASSQSKEFGYSDAMDYITNHLKDTKAQYVADSGSKARGEKYLQNLITGLLQPNVPTKFERLQNKLIATTYKSQLGFSPKFAAQNITQRYATKIVTSKAAGRLASKVDKGTWDDLYKGLSTGYNPIMAEAEATADSVGKVKGVVGKLGKLDPGQKVEKGNVQDAFKRGVSQAVLDSDAYKGAIKDGMKPKDAFAEALKDPATKDLAIRRGNVVVNTTQFGGNIAAKPEFLRETGSFLGLSKKWYQQYQRFPVGMMQHIGSIVKPDDARAIDILRRGDPRETPIVDYKKAAVSLQSGVDDLIKGIKNGEVHDVDIKSAQNYKKLLGEAVDNLDKQMKGASQIRSGKTVKNLGKMWLAASAIQFLFDGGGTNTGKTQGEEVGRAITYGAPINVPTKNENPLLGARIPSSPVTSTGVSTRKLLNFVPGVGLAVNRGNDIGNFIKSLTGDASN